jgi:hypothetical protein
LLLLIALVLAELFKLRYELEFGVLGAGGPYISWLTVGIVFAVSCFVSPE